ncbi:polyphosphate kinase 1 [Mucilaginibacter auburnensis]|uniref:Polyphosphate kinase n=1 Tax=Mucilaginibacter auburnensis TaxID=1457233 RepID=A0A2H9VR85_9SPHI|nr:polyphosphate kinase 1 [Mucilaginibacter auburnensis]PJJ83319.1 polyphosphate kinase [Mucilaginibacter auburnensis]
MKKDHFYNRDLSWLSFNGRVLQEAARPDVPLLEKVNFLAIFSSNLDEFYRVRMPVLIAMDKLGKFADEELNPLLQARQVIMRQQNLFGSIFREEILAGLAKHDVCLLFNEELPATILPQITDYFYSQVMAFLRPVDVLNDNHFEPKNNEIYFLVTLAAGKKEQVFALQVPSELPRFFKVNAADKTYIVFLDDIIKNNLDKLFKDVEITGYYSFKITRDAELELKDEYPGDLSEQIEQQLQHRDEGIATRFLHQPGVPLRTLQLIGERWNIASASFVEGGMYHNFKDLSSLPLDIKALKYSKWPTAASVINRDEDLFSQIEREDILVNTPYQPYDAILRFFNEASQDSNVIEINITLYRVARDSRIIHALINAALMGKKVTVMVELKARFDEANNIKWAKRMKAAGVNIIYSITALKVHAKVALVKRMVDNRAKYYGLLSTGNFNENTAAYYTDHILMTANGDLLREMELLFLFLAKRQKPQPQDQGVFSNLLVAGFNLQQRFLEMIDREMANAQKGLPAAVTIKLNNLEERVLISKLYEASRAGVKVSLIVRSICCLIPGQPGMSDNITIKRIVDRYLEHGRIFIFHNNGNPEVFMGSADWMNRNIYRRIEVCFPVLSSSLKEEVIAMVTLQLQDNVKAVWLNDKIENIAVTGGEPSVQSQQAISDMLNHKILQA